MISFTLGRGFLLNLILSSLICNQNVNSCIYMLFLSVIFLSMYIIYSMLCIILTVDDQVYF